MAYGEKTEPRDAADKPVDPNLAARAEAEYSKHRAAIEKLTPEEQKVYDQVPSSTIPAKGTGNSEDGQRWLNPSANQLYRSFMRKDKPIDQEDSPSVAVVHEAVTTQSWEQIMEYEQFHKGTCSNPSLARFQGMYGIPTMKSRFMGTFFGVKPYDRHDWTVDRCGKEVKYIIDYYAAEQPHGGLEMFIDARPAVTFGGVVDRVRLAWNRYRRGESIW